MGLSCSCDYDPEPGDTVCYMPNDFSTYTSKRRTKCVSCGSAIKSGDTVAVFDRYKVPMSDVEVRIYGEHGEIPRATWFHCEECAGLYFSLNELGFCPSPDENQRQLVAEYAAMRRLAKARGEA